MQPPKGKKERVVEEVKLGPNVPEGEEVFAVAHIFASFNDTFVVCNHVHSHHHHQHAGDWCVCTHLFPSAATHPNST